MIREEQRWYSQLERMHFRYEKTWQISLTSWNCKMSLTTQKHCIAEPYRELALENGRAKWSRKVEMYMRWARLYLDSVESTHKTSESSSFSQLAWDLEDLESQVRNSPAAEQETSSVRELYAYRQIVPVWSPAHAGKEWNISKPELCPLSSCCMQR